MKVFDFNEEDSLKWVFDEFLKVLITMALPLDQQKEVCGIAVVADDMLDDFNSYYTMVKDEFIKNKLIEPDAEKLLDEIDQLVAQWTKEKEKDFWFEMDKYQEEWDSLRKMAKSALKFLCKENWGIKIKRENEFDKSGLIRFQKIVVELIEKK